MKISTRLMKTQCVKGFGPLFVVGLIWSCTTPGQQDNPAGKGSMAKDAANTVSDGCLKLSEDLRQRMTSSGFVGFGDARSSEDATSAASADLLSQVQTMISARGTVTETATSVEVSNLTESTVQAMLTGLKIEKRCQSGPNWQAVVSLGRDTFFKNIRLRIKPVLDQATQIQQNLTSSQSNASESGSVKDRIFEAVRGKKLLASAEGKAAENLLVICQTFNSCGMIDASPLQKLPATISSVLARFSFTMRSKDEEAAQILDQVGQLLAKEGLAVTSTPSPNEAILSCQRKDFPPMAQTGYMVTDLICQVAFSTDGGEPVAGFIRQFKGHGLGESRQEALSEARRRLIAIDPA